MPSVEKRSCSNAGSNAGGRPWTQQHIQHDDLGGSNTQQHAADLYGRSNTKVARTSKPLVGGLGDVRRRRIGFRSGSREIVLGPGGYITKPRGELHAMWNAGDEPARMIEIIIPAGFEGYFREVSDLIEGDPSDPSRVAALSERYGLSFGTPDWLPDLIARYRLNPPPGSR